jgi:cytidylate kinase
MDGRLSIKRVTPKTLIHTKTGNEELMARYLRVWTRQEPAWTAMAPSAGPRSELAPCITLSRKIGVGALEVAEIVADKLGYAVADRALIEQIANQAEISEKAIAFFDERFPGYANRTFKYLFGEKAFIDSDYSRHLVRAVLGMAASAPTVFVGRGAHMILPRDRVLAVRCICSDDYRAGRMAKLLGIGKAAAMKKISSNDKEQAAFFRKVFGLKEAVAYEFDLVINLDHICDPGAAADIIVLAFERKYTAKDDLNKEKITA